VRVNLKFVEDATRPFAQSAQRGPAERPSHDGLFQDLAIDRRTGDQEQSENELRPMPHQPAERSAIQPAQKPRGGERQSKAEPPRPAHGLPCLGSKTGPSPQTMP